MIIWTFRKYFFTFLCSIYFSCICSVYWITFLFDAFFFRSIIYWSSFVFFWLFFWLFWNFLFNICSISVDNCSIRKLFFQNTTWFAVTFSIELVPNRTKLTFFLSDIKIPFSTTWLTNFFSNIEKGSFRTSRTFFCSQVICPSRWTSKTAIIFRIDKWSFQRACS